MNGSASPHPSSTTLLENVFTTKSPFRLACALGALTVFSLLRALTAMFGTVSLDELQSVYYLIHGGGDLKIGLVNLFFGAVAVIILCVLTLSMFRTISAAHYSDSNKMLKSIRTVKITLVAALCFTGIMITCALVSVGTINYYHNVISQFYDNLLTSSSKELLIQTILFGIPTLVTEIAFLKLTAGLEKDIHGKYAERNIRFWEICVIFIGELAVLYTFLSSLYDVIEFDYNLLAKSPARLAMLILTVLICIGVIMALLYFVDLAAIYHNTERKSELSDNDENQPFESRVFPKTPLKTIDLSEHTIPVPDIPHTVYPDNTLQESDE